MVAPYDDRLRTVGKYKDEGVPVLRKREDGRLWKEDEKRKEIEEEMIHKSTEKDAVTNEETNTVETEKEEVERLNENE